MGYRGKLYAKIKGKYIECTESVKDLEDKNEALNSYNERLQIEIAELKQNLKPVKIK